MQSPFTQNPVAQSAEIKEVGQPRNPGDRFDHNPVPLDYAPGKTKFGKRRLGIFLVAVLFIVVAMALYKPVMRKVRVLNCQARCMAYNKPPRTPTLSYDSPLRNDPDYRFEFLTSGQGGDSSEDPAGGYIMSPQCWNIFALESGIVALQAVGAETILLHEMTSPGGHRRLVRIRLDDDNRLIFPRSLGYDIVIPATIFRDAKLASSQIGRTWHQGSFDRIRAYFGQTDPSDPSHLTIESDQGAVVDGWLKDDETIVFRRR